ncbi:SAM-dependent methyltransferase [Isoalcanivorax indicus]|uniref:SAM-dependent methyltransferase n=1 Tax=Isoalcanivorax indicus TaxID=2202653 RepID=UPI001FEAC186|nr:cyclopropane-fatty-acyl-phospholipid synthase family protein [Isoalcanivorax indicus]
MPRDTASSITSRRRQNALALPTGSGGSKGAALALERKLLVWLLRMAGSPPVRLCLWDGSTVGPAQAAHTLTLRDRAAFYALLRNPNMAFGDLYACGRLQVSGRLDDFLTLLYPCLEAGRQAQPAWLSALWRDRAPRGASEQDARLNIHHHYDLGNAFYRLWLDSAAMQYTCAYFEQPDFTLEQAQLAKLEHVCRKLRLRPGQTVIEAGCGWGGLARYMARHYGVRVQAFNISSEQIAWAREQARREGLDDRVTYIEDDYRNIGAGGTVSPPCDAFVSVGMLEHVGPENYAALATAIRRVLAPTGIGLIHTIGRNRPAPINGWIERRIFPGSYVPSPVELMRLFEDGHFSVLDMENLRLHYATTLRHWHDRFQAHREQIRAEYDDTFVRAWELYLAGSTAAFQTGTLQLFQVVFSPAESNAVPRHRRDLYAGSALDSGGAPHD